MSDLMNRLKKNSRSKFSSALDNSSIFKDVEPVTTSVPMLNVALSGKLDGGLYPGLTMLAGPSKHFKSNYALLIASAFLKKYDDGVLLFYDSEFGSSEKYFKSMNIDPSRVFHTPITNVEELKNDLVRQLEDLNEKDNVIIIIDSVGNVASKKELEDALNDKSVADMSRAKAFKGFYRMVTPYLNLKKIPMLVINHTYDSMGLFPQKVVSGGTGGVYSSNDIWIIGRQQEKEGTEVSGYNFIINIDKSRKTKEKSKIPISVRWDGGVQKYSGLLDLAVEGGFVEKPSKGWYARVDLSTGEIEDKKYREKQTHTSEFWNPILNNEKFKKFVEDKFSIPEGKIVSEDEIVDPMSSLPDLPLAETKNKDLTEEEWHNPTFNMDH